jgi:hypothetical protein
MSTTGHYTRYINQYPGWSDNCDTMYKPIVAECLIKEKYDYPVIGYFQVEHNAGNTWSWSKINFKDRSYVTIYEHTGKKAIQNVLDHVEKLTFDQCLDIIFKYCFYNRSYLDYSIEVE